MTQDNKQTPEGVKLIAYLITDGTKWVRVGRAFLNRDASYNILLDDDVQLSGGQKIHVRRVVTAKAKPAPETAPA